LTGPSVVEPRHDQAVKSLVDECDSLGVAGVFEIKGVVEDNEVRATSGKRTVHRCRKDAATRGRGKIACLGAILSHARGE
jgi:hypothetical protein